MNSSLFPCTRRTSLGCAAALLLAAVHPDARRSFATANLRDFLRGKKSFDPPVVLGDESIMCQKAHGTSNMPVQQDLRWGCSVDIADEICNFNRHYAERAGYWETTGFLQDKSMAAAEVTFYDSNSGEPLFYAPRGRNYDQFVEESRAHGWPSFRDDEVNWERVRVLPNGETVSIDGTHLGHNLPDHRGNRYCINLVCIAGRPKSTSTMQGSFQGTIGKGTVWSLRQPGFSVPVAR